MAVTVNVCVFPPLKDDFHRTMARVSSQTNSKLFGLSGLPVIGKKEKKISAFEKCFVSNFLKHHYGLSRKTVYTVELK